MFTKIPWGTILDTQYSMVEKAQALASKSHKNQCPVADAPVSTPLEWQVPVSIPVYSKLHIRNTVSLVFCILLFYPLWPDSLSVCIEVNDIDDRTDISLELTTTQTFRRAALMQLSHTLT